MHNLQYKIDELEPSIASKYQTNRRGRRSKRREFPLPLQPLCQSFSIGFEMGSCSMSGLDKLPPASEAFIVVQRGKWVEVQHVVGDWLPRKT
jgi:hypothetical protein